MPLREGQARVNERAVVPHVGELANRPFEARLVEHVGQKVVEELVLAHGRAIGLCFLELRLAGAHVEQVDAARESLTGSRLGELEVEISQVAHTVGDHLDLRERHRTRPEEFEERLHLPCTRGLDDSGGPGVVLAKVLLSQQVGR